MTDIRQQIATFIVDNMLLGRPLDVASVASFLDAGIIDSTGVLELVRYLEETWGIEVADEEIVPDNLDSLAKLTAFVTRKRAG